MGEFRLLSKLSGHADSVLCCEFSPSSNLLASGSEVGYRSSITEFHPFFLCVPGELRQLSLDSKKTEFMIFTGGEMVVECVSSGAYALWSGFVSIYVSVYV